MLLDREQRVVGALAGQPRDIKGWRAVHDSAFSALEYAASQIKPKAPKKPKEIKSRRGLQISLSHGISYGGGQQVRAV
jgi:hypothetical protein